MGMILNKIIFGDCRDSLRKLADDGVKVQMCVTSPPYFGLRDYGHDGQLGQEETPMDFIASLVAVFRLVRDVMADDGTLWLNIGDSYARNPKKGTTGTPNGRNTSDMGYSGGGGIPSGLKEKDLIGIPWMLAFDLRADGWYLRQDIIWHKPNPMPESVQDRCTKSHEYIFLLSKGSRYFFDSEAIREDAVRGYAGSDFRKGKTAEHQLGRGSQVERIDDGKRNRRSVWSVATKPYSGAHFAVFPPALIEPCILAGSRAGDIVLDPFMGSGTTAEVSIMHGRQFVGCELNEDYQVLQDERIAAARESVSIKTAQKDFFATEI